METTIEEYVKSIRTSLKSIGKDMIDLKKVLVDAKHIEDTELRGEAIANATLAFRHTEDSAMRLGKVLQALNGGESVYDNSGVVPQK